MKGEPLYRCFRDLLPNGLRAVTIETPHLHTALVAVYVRVGSRHETAADNGVSHFLEHLFFRGSERFPDTIQMNGLVEDVGGNLNGITMRDQSFYYTALHASGLQTGLEVLGDLLIAPRFAQVEIEREIILEEILDEVDREGRDIDVGNLSKRLVFGNHPLGFKIAGTRENIRTLPVERMRAHHRKHYVAENMVAVAAGPIDRARTLDLMARAFERLPRGERACEIPAAFTAPRPGFLFVDHDESQTEIELTFPCVPEDHPDHPALSLLRAILDDGLTSRLPYHIVERRGLAYSIHAGIDLFCDTSLFEIESACAPNKVVPVFEEIVAQLARLVQERVPENELDRLKRRQRIGLEFALDDLNALAGWYGATELFRVPEPFEERVERFEQVTPADLQRVAAATFRRDNLYVCAVGPAKGHAEASLRQAIERAF